MPEGSWPQDLLPAPFHDGARPGLLEVLPPLLEAPQGGRDVVVVLDGVGSELLEEHRAHTPTLRRLLADPSARTLRTVAPSTTAAAMTSLHTGLSPLEHGVLGYTTLDPSTGRAVNQLTGETGLDPARWMPAPTLLQRHPRRAVQVSPAKHSGSHLSRMAFRGWDFLGHGRHDRADAAVVAARRAGSDGIVHLHVDDVDHAGHQHGVDSDAWREALGEADALLGALLRRLPRGTRVHITADHGMVDTDRAHSVDLAEHPRLRSLIRTIAGEPRALALSAHRGQEQQLAQQLRELLGERAHVLARDELLAAGLLGVPGQEIPAHVDGRIPDVLVLGRGRWVVEDFSRLRPDAPRQIGVHGSLTARESLIPLLRAEV